MTDTSTKSATASGKQPAEHINELKDLVVGYAKQETVDPLRNLGRYLRNGVGGALAIGLGVVLLLLALLRGLQSIDTFEGDTGALSLVPYAATITAGLVVIVLAAYRITQSDEKGPTS